MTLNHGDKNMGNVQSRRIVFVETLFGERFVIQERRKFLGVFTYWKRVHLAASEAEAVKSVEILERRDSKFPLLGTVVKEYTYE